MLGKLVIGQHPIQGVYRYPQLLPLTETGLFKALTAMNKLGITGNATYY